MYECPYDGVCYVACVDVYIYSVSCYMFVPGVPEGRRGGNKSGSTDEYHGSGTVYGGCGFISGRKIANGGSAPFFHLEM